MFVVDQREPLSTTEEAIKDKVIPEIDVRTETRKQLFVDQIKPSGHFGLNDELVYSTGNGCAGMMGWL
jgi:hypothetical protein